MSRNPGGLPKADLTDLVKLLQSNSSVGIRFQYNPALRGLSIRLDMDGMVYDLERVVSAREVCIQRNGSNYLYSVLEELVARIYRTNESDSVQEG